MTDRITAFDYRQRAEEFRRVADGMEQPEARKKLLDAADAYERMADRMDLPENSPGSS